MYSEKHIHIFNDFPGGSAVKKKKKAGDTGSIPVLGRSLVLGNGTPAQYCCLENPHGQRSLVGYSPYKHKESDTAERRSTQRTDSILLKFS